MGRGRYIRPDEVSGICDVKAPEKRPNYHYPQDEQIAAAAVAKQKANPGSALTRIVAELVVEAKLQPRVMLELHVRRITRHIANSRS